MVFNRKKHIDINASDVYNVKKKFKSGMVAITMACIIVCYCGYKM